MCELSTATTNPSISLFFIFLYNFSTFFFAFCFCFDRLWIGWVDMIWEWNVKKKNVVGQLLGLLLYCCYINISRAFIVILRFDWISLLSWSIFLLNLLLRHSTVLSLAFVFNHSSIHSSSSSFFNDMSESSVYAVHCAYVLLLRLDQQHCHRISMALWFRQCQMSGFIGSIAASYSSSNEILRKSIGH